MVGMMGGVNTAYDYYTLMGFGHKGADGEPVVTNALLQGGIVSVYYLGTLVGCLIGGSIGDRFGRIKTIFVGAAVATVGACLQCSAMNHEWMICARLVNGWGTGILNSIIPVWATETAEHTSRGQFIAIEFTLNIFGVVIAYWLEYACSFYGDGTSSFIWRFPIAFQIPMLMILMAGVLFFSEVSLKLNKRVIPITDILQVTPMACKSWQRSRGSLCPCPSPRIHRRGQEEGRSRISRHCCFL